MMLMWKALKRRPAMRVVTCFPPFRSLARFLVPFSLHDAHCLVVWISLLNRNALVSIYGDQSRELRRVHGIGWCAFMAATIRFLIWKWVKRTLKGAETDKGWGAANCDGKYSAASPQRVQEASLLLITYCCLPNRCVWSVTHQVPLNTITTKITHSTKVGWQQHTLKRINDIQGILTSMRFFKLLVLS